MKKNLFLLLVLGSKILVSAEGDPQDQKPFSWAQYNKVIVDYRKNLDLPGAAHPVFAPLTAADKARIADQEARILAAIAAQRDPAVVADEALIAARMKAADRQAAQSQKSTCCSIQ